LATRDKIFEPRLYGIRQMHGLSAEMNSWQTARAFKVLDDISVTPGMADLRDTEKPDQFFFCHDGGAEPEITV
jgi:hypothetical protein